MITFVTTFIHLQEDRSGCKTVDFYFQQFKRLVNTGINIHLFLQSSMISKYNEIIGSPLNVYVDIQEFEDIEICNQLKEIQFNLPLNRNTNKDTLNYLIIQNSKIYFIKKAIDSNIYNTEKYAWIDFGIGHVIKYEDTLNDLKNIKFDKGLFIPGCHIINNVNLNNICWRFCGGFFVGDKESLLNFYSLYRNNFIQIVKNTGILSWEVNIWAYFEKYLGLKPIWYYGDHNDSMLNFLSKSIIHSTSS